MSSIQSAIVGIGATDFSKRSGRSELHLAVEAIAAALQDAGIRPEEVDGLVTYTMDSSPEVEVARNLGIPAIRFMAQSPYGGGGACSPLQYAGLAIGGKAADVVVCYRAFNERSGHRFGNALPTTGGAAANAMEVMNGWNTSFGLATAAAFMGVFACRYMHEYGATSEDFGRVTVAARENAATNPKAWFYQRPITLADHQASAMVADPLRLLDCCQESDGGVALVVTSLERARDLAHKPAVIRATAQGSTVGQQNMGAYYRDSITALPEIAYVAGQLWRGAGIGKEDVQCAILYDHFTPFVLLQLEALGYCNAGEARHFIADGHISRSGSLPINPHGGLLGEAYIHGLNGIAEAVRQIRGTAVNQIANVEHVLVTAGTAVPTGGLILGQDW
jgi:acetyl-CoA acetyltransferase